MRCAALVAEARAEVPPELPPALACLVGYIGYEAVRLVEPSVPANDPSPLGLPDMVFVRPTLLLVFDRLKDELFIVAPVFAADDAGAAYAAAIERIETAQARLARPQPPRAAALTDLPDGTPGAAPGARRLCRHGRRAPRTTSSPATSSRSCWPSASASISRCRRSTFTGRCAASTPRPSSISSICPASRWSARRPEILVRVRDGDVTIRPIAGTRPRGRDAVEDAENKASLLADAKEQAEHLMLLDLGRHDTGRVALPGTVTVTGPRPGRILQPCHAHRLERARPARSRATTPSTRCSPASRPAR